MDQENKESDKCLLNSYEEAHFFNDFCCIDYLIFRGLSYEKEKKDVCTGVYKLSYYINPF